MFINISKKKTVLDNKNLNLNLKAGDWDLRKRMVAINIEYGYR